MAEILLRPRLSQPALDRGYSGSMDTALAVTGFVIIVAVIAEVFRDLFRPGDSGALTDLIGRGWFDLLRRSRRLLPLAGPLTVITVIGSWVTLLICGFAFVYYGHYPADFRTSLGAVPPADGRFVAGLYFSFETLITLGYGDIVPQSTAMRFLSSSEALVGFGLLTASITSIVLLYPALSRMRVLARGISHIVEAEHRTGTPLARSDAHTIYAGLAEDVTHARIDLVHFPVLYYFATNDARASVATWTRDLRRLASEGLQPDLPPAVRLAAATLDAALNDFAAIIAERFLAVSASDRDAVFEHLARDHRVSTAAPR